MMYKQYQTTNRGHDVSFEKLSDNPSERKEYNSAMKKSESKATLLTRATSFMTWDTWDASSRTRQPHQEHKSYQTTNRVQDVSFEKISDKSSERKEQTGAMKKSGSKATLLTRATSFMTWDTWDTSSRTRQFHQEKCDDDEEAQMFPALLKRTSLQSLTGFTILPTIYGSTNKPYDEDVGDDVSEFSYMTG